MSPEEFLIRLSGAVGLFAVSGVMAFLGVRFWKLAFKEKSDEVER